MAARRTYTTQQRAHALALYQQHGLAHAATETGIPAKTISTWAARSGVKTDFTPKKTREATETATANRAEQAEREATAALHDAAQLRPLLTQAARVAAQRGQLRALVDAYTALHNAGTARLPDQQEEVNQPAHHSVLADVTRRLAAVPD